MKANQYFSLGAIAELARKPQLLLKLPGFFRDLKAYRKLELGASPMPLRFYPCLEDRRQTQCGHGNYFYQDCWAARQVFRERPEWGVDVGSTVLLVGILSQFTRWVSVDIRPILSELKGMDCKEGSVLELPFADGEVPCLTTMCVLEHIGLGRYGDPLDPFGTEKAAREIARVVKPGGTVIYSVPVGREVLEFNAHRRFAYSKAAQLFAGWSLIDSCILTPAPREYEGEDSLSRIPDAVACFCCRKPL